MLIIESLDAVEAHRAAGRLSIPLADLIAGRMADVRAAFADAGAVWDPAEHGAFAVLEAADAPDAYDAIGLDRDGGLVGACWECCYRHDGPARAWEVVYLFDNDGGWTVFVPMDAAWVDAALLSKLDDEATEPFAAVGREGERAPFSMASCNVCLGDGPLPVAEAQALARAVPVLRVAQVRRAGPGDRPTTCPHRAAALARQLLDRQDREAFVVLHLDHKRRAVSAEVVAVGTLSSTLVHPREVFKGALLANASAIILAHNHPSGDATPSAEDVALTRTLVAAGALLGVPVEDHLVVGEVVVSLREATDIW